MIVVGLVVTAWLLPGPRQVGSVTFDVHTMLYAALAVIVGYASVVYFVCARAFAVSEGLLPEDRRVARLLRVATLESGLAAGLVALGAGVAGSIYAVSTWKTESFGRLDYSDTMRIVIPSALSIVLGVQTIVSSFFLAILGLKRR